MSLAHPTGHLILEKYDVFEKDIIDNPHLLLPGADPVPVLYPACTAYFHALTRRELLLILSNSLLAEKRFCHQLHRPVSVLEHQWWMYRFLQHEDPELADHALIHDAPEGLVHDCVRGLKTREDAMVEDAIERALAWPEQMSLSRTGDAPSRFKKWDSIAPAAEATLFGPKWAWIQSYRDRYGAPDVDHYLEHLSEYLLQDGDLREIEAKWIEAVTQKLMADGQNLDVFYQAPTKVVEGLVIY